MLARSNLRTTVPSRILTPSTKVVAVSYLKQPKNPKLHLLDITGRPNKRQWEEDGTRMASLEESPFQDSGSNIRAPDNRGIRSLQRTRNPGVSTQQLLIQKWSLRVRSGRKEWRDLSHGTGRTLERIAEWLAVSYFSYLPFMYFGSMITIHHTRNYSGPWDWLHST